MNQKMYYFARQMGATAYYLSIAARGNPCGFELVASAGAGTSQVIWGSDSCFIRYFSNSGAYSLLQLVKDANAGGSDNCTVSGFPLGWLGGNFDGNEVGQLIPLTLYGIDPSSNASECKLFFQPDEIMPAGNDFLGMLIYVANDICQTAQFINGSWGWTMCAPKELPWTITDMTPVAGLITNACTDTYADLPALVAAVGLQPGGYLQLPAGATPDASALVIFAAAGNPGTPGQGDVYVLSSDGTTLSYLSTLLDSNGVVIPFSNLQAMVTYLGETDYDVIAPNAANDITQPATSFLATRNPGNLTLPNGTQLMQAEIMAGFTMQEALQAGTDIMMIGALAKVPRMSAIGNFSFGWSNEGGYQTGYVAVAAQGDGYGNIRMTLDPITGQTMISSITGDSRINITGYCKFQYVPIS